MERTYRISIPLDDEGMMGRECPQPDCQRYFKVKPGTGIVDNPTMYCPYCKHKGSPNDFCTKEQIEYAQSIVVRDVTSKLLQDLKRLERESFQGPLFSMKIEVRGTPPPIQRYLEQELQEKLVCETCTCEYAIYGVFAVCPDCDHHNAFQVLDKNLDLIRRQAELKANLYQKFGGTHRQELDQLVTDLGDKLLEDACENTVSVFEAFCRAIYDHNRDKAKNPNQRLRRNVFQSLDEAQRVFARQFDVDILAGLSHEQIDALYLLFNKRHIITHNLGVIDQKFLSSAKLRHDILGHKVDIWEKEIVTGLDSIRVIAENIKSKLHGS